jgi:hypothetical protein
MDRQQLRDAGYVDMLGSTDLDRYGWRIRHWLNPWTGALAWEYIPIRRHLMVEKTPGFSLVAHSYRDQVMAHMLIGAPVFPAAWMETHEASAAWEQPTLFP